MLLELPNDRELVKNMPEQADAHTLTSLQALQWSAMVCNTRVAIDAIHTDLSESPVEALACLALGMVVFLHDARLHVLQLLAVQPFAIAILKGVMGQCGGLVANCYRAGG